MVSRPRDKSLSYNVQLLLNQFDGGVDLTLVLEAVISGDPLVLLTGVPNILAFDWDANCINFHVIPVTMVEHALETGAKGLTPSVCPSVCLSVCLSVFHRVSKGFFSNWCYQIFFFSIYLQLFWARCISVKSDRCCQTQVQLLQVHLKKTAIWTSIKPQ